MSFCTACGANNNDDSTFCISCGAKLQKNTPQNQPMYSQPVAPQPMYTQPVQQPTYTQPAYAQPSFPTSQVQPVDEKPSRKCLAAGILSIVFSWLGLSLIFGPVAIVKGANVLKKFGPTGSAIAAIVLGSIGLLITGGIVFTLIYMASGGYFGAGSYLPGSYYYY